jgi:hypothetical protein
MRHPFDLSLTELQAIDLDSDLDFEEAVSDSEAEQVGGGTIYTTLALGEEGGYCPPPRPIPYPDRCPPYNQPPLPKPIPRPICPPIVHPPVTRAWGEDDCTATTLALGEEGGGWPV